MTQAEFAQRLDEAYPDDVKRELTIIVTRGYSEILKVADEKGLINPFRDRSIPQERCYLIQQRVFEEFGRGRHRGVTAITRMHDSGTEPYTVVSAGGFHLTVSMVRSRKALPRSTPFRRANAQLNTLFSGIDGDANDDRYVILSHVPAPNNQRPLHLDLLVPNSRYSAAEFVLDWSPLVEFQMGGVVVPSEEVKPAELKLKGQQGKQAGGA